MSNVFGGIVIHQDEADTGIQGLKKSRNMEAQSKVLATKRSALGTITNNTRIQPARAAKQYTDGFLTIGQQNENGPTKAKSAFNIPSASLQSFTIHADDEPAQVNVQTHQPKSRTSFTQDDFTENLQIHPAVAALKPAFSVRSEAASAVLDGITSYDSPMVLDTSIVDTCSHEDTIQARLEKIISVPEYSEDIYRYLREAEQRHRPKCGYMKKQPDINSNMRTILVDWMVEVSEEYKLHRETLCLAVNYIDRFLSQMSVLRGKLQLVGAACMFLAAKYEEIYPPDVGEFVYITDDTYTKKQVLRMEHLVLKVLSFDVAVPTVNCFCETFLKMAGVDEKTAALANYLIELSLVEESPYHDFLPSLVAASAITLANCTVNPECDAWPTALVEATGYSIQDMKDCLQALYTTLYKSPDHPQQAVRDKYKQSKYQQVAMCYPPASSQDARPVHLPLS